MSKRVFNKCKYVYKKGTREGEICNASCKGEYCKNHNENRNKYCSKYYGKRNDLKSKLTFKEKISKMKKMSINKFRSMNFYRSRCNKIAYEAGFMYKQILGIGLILNPDYYEKIIDDKIKKRGFTISGRHPVYIEFTGKKVDAEKKFKKLMESRKYIVEKYRKAKIIMDLAEKRFNKYFKENNEYPSNY